MKHMKTICKLAGHLTNKTAEQVYACYGPDKATEIVRNDTGVIGIIGRNVFLLNETKETGNGR